MSRLPFTLRDGLFHADDSLPITFSEHITEDATTGHPIYLLVAESDRGTREVFAALVPADPDEDWLHERREEGVGYCLNCLEAVGARI